MNVSNVTINDIKSCKDLEEKIKKNILSKYYYAGISFKEVIEFINRVDDYKLQIYYPDSLEEEQLLAYLNEQLQIEVKNRIKSGEISLVKRSLEPYSAFLNGTNKLDKACDIIEKELTKIGIHQDWKILEEIYTKVAMINKLIGGISAKYNEKIMNNDYSFIETPTIIKLLKIHKLKKENKTIKVEPNEKDVIFESKLASCLYAAEIKKFLLKNNMNLRHIYIILFRYNLYKYEPESIENLANYFGITETRIRIEQDDAMDWIFSNHLEEPLAKLYPYPKETLKYFRKIHQNGFNSKIKLEVKDKNLKFQKSLTELTKLSKEQLRELVAKLTLLDQSYINDKYDANFELKYKDRYDRERTMIIVQKLTKLATGQEYILKGNKNANLSAILNIPKDKLEKLITRFTAAEQDFIYKIYFANFDKRRVQMTPQDYGKIRILKRDLLLLNNDPNYEPKKTKNLYLRLGITKEELEANLVNLSPEKQEILKNWYDEKWDEIKLFPNDNERKEISNIIIEFKATSKIKKPKKPETLHDYFGITILELKNIISKLPASDQKLIEEYYDNNYISKDNLAESELIKNNKKRIKTTIRRLISNPNYLEKKKKTLYKYYDISKEKQENIITLLETEDQEIIKKYYTEDFVLKDIESTNDYPSIKKKLVKIKRTIRKLINNPNYLIELKNKKKKRSLSLCKYYNVTKEKLQEIILLLPEEDQNIIKTYFDENYIKIATIPIDEAEKIKSKLISIKRTIGKLIINPNYLIEKKANAIAQTRQKTNMYKYYGISKEYLEKIISLLDEDDRNTLKKHYDDDYCFKDNIQEFEKEKIKNKLKRIKITIRKLINDPNYLEKKREAKRNKGTRFKALHEQLNITKENLTILIQKLNEKDRNLLNIFYDENYERRTNIPKEYANSSSNLYVIKGKIKRLQTDPSYNPNRESKLKEKKDVITLYKYLNITKEELENLIASLSVEEQMLLKSSYDENYHIIKQKGVDSKIAQQRNSRLSYIRKKLKIMMNPEQKKQTTLYKFLNLTKEELEELIKKLNSEDQQVLKVNYDKEYYKITIPGLVREEYAKINSRLNSIRNKIKRLNNDPNYNLQKKNTTKKEKEYVTLYKLLKVTKEQLEALIVKLPEADQEIIKSSYDEDYRPLRKARTDKKAAQLKSSKLNYIRKKLRKMINPEPINPGRTLYSVLKITKEKLNEVISKLEDKDRNYIYTVYNKEFEPLSKENLSDKEKSLIISRMATIRKKIRLFLDNPNYVKVIKTKSLCKRLNTDLLTTNKLVNLLSKDEKDLIFATYDTINNFEPRQNINNGNLTIITRTIIPKLKRYLNNGIQVSRRTKSSSSNLDLVIKSQISTTTQDKLNILELIIMMSLTTGESYSTTAIAKYLGLEEAKVKDMIKNYLLNCQEKYNKALEEHINKLDEPITLLRAKDLKKKKN